MILLNDGQMQDFIVNGFVSVHADFPGAFHESIRCRAESIFANEGNPGNSILPRIPDLAEMFAHPAVAGALTSVLGAGYAMHAHRHCHLTPPNRPAQRHHQDSYEDDRNVRHHRTRWAMAFYYPQDVSAKMGPTSVLPASQYYTSRDQAERIGEMLLCGPAGTVTIVNYDLWHRATENLSDRNRFMLKFLFCRMAEPAAPSWNLSPACPRPTFDGAASPALCRSVWRWYQGKSGGEAELGAGRESVRGDSPTGGDRPAAGISEKEFEAKGDSTCTSESDKLQQVYMLAAAGESGRAALMKSLEEEADARLESNLAARYTNPSQLQASFGLSALGPAAVGGLVDALRAPGWPLRAAAADILGDIGLGASPAVPHLLECLSDESEWVRRNAAEALGVIAAPESVPALASSLAEDRCDFVRHNAALSLAKIGKEVNAARASLENSLGDENLYVRANARLALIRCAK